MYVLLHSPLVGPLTRRRMAQEITEPATLVAHSNAGPFAPMIADAALS